MFSAWVLDAWPTHEFDHLCHMPEKGAAVLVPNPDDCSKFIMCNRLHGLEITCPVGTLYDDL